MARPLKENASYFSHDADMRNNRKVKAMRARFGLEGYAAWCMILECLTDENGFVLPWDALNIELISGDFGLSAERLVEISEYMAKIGLVEILSETLRCPSHRARMQFVIDERERKRQWKQVKKEVSDGENQEIDGENAQTKGKEIKGKEIKGKERGGEGTPARAEDSSNETTPTTTPPSNAFAQIRAAIQAWQDQDNSGALRKIAADQKYLGPIDPEITRFITHNLSKDPYRERITRAPLDFFLEQFPGWLCLPAAQRNSKAQTNGSAQQNGAYTKPMQREQDADLHISESEAKALISQHAGECAGKFTTAHISNIRSKMSRRTAIDLIHAIAQTINNGHAPPRTIGNAKDITVNINTA